MGRYKLTAAEKLARLADREDTRARRGLAVEANRAWHDARRVLADKRAARAAKAREKARKKKEKAQRKQPRVTVTPHTVSKHGLPIDSTLGSAFVHGRRITANHAQRRAIGQRGKVRKPRRRELPRAIERRVARNKAEWGSS